MLIQMLSEDPIRYLRIVAIVIISVTLHELAHGFAALSQGDDTPRKTGHMTLNPIVHMGWESIIFLAIGGITWGQMPVNPRKFRSAKWGNILVSAAGPLSNLALGILSIVLLIIATRFDILSLEFFYLAAQINLALCLFNLLPIPPLDGFNVFREFIPQLKVLDDYRVGMFAMMVLFLAPGLSSGLYVVSDLFIRLFIGID
ncbi:MULTISPECIES: site-2 protease family protein [Calothrix]|uniref:Site-2 protease family protein n=2 Tax=Calothrix TaxID=1186 RepID=A0ABR8ALL6_9CYAN|nr:MULTISPECIES: site-2 protease family protein [Calothrix]MBD2200704.1 site-2 protease family protein [Calothrix parietina FACHB-288]MBD2229746.1 site-2 protease family protein [Calothrix anomala FACHB-343]